MDNAEKLIKDGEMAEIISINGAGNLDDMQKRYPNMKIVIGKATPEDKPVPLNLVDMEEDRRLIVDAATETVLGKRIDVLEKPIKFPLASFTFVLGAMTAATICLLMYGVI